jgi:hypothetical protein
LLGLMKTAQSKNLSELVKLGNLEARCIHNPPCPDIKPNNVVAIVLLNNTVLDERTN